MTQTIAQRERLAELARRAEAARCAGVEIPAEAGAPKPPLWGRIGETAVAVALVASACGAAAAIALKLALSSGLAP